MECPVCNRRNPDDSKFCNKCGYRFVDNAGITDPTPPMASERKYVTIMFSDMSGYTAMTEKLDPEEVKEIMSQVFGEITRIIQSYEGFIERFIGDAVMAVFGVPKAHEDDSVRAIKAAIDIHRAVNAISPRFEEKIGSSLNMHTGINSGLVVTGEVDVEKGIHGLTGDAINLASRLEGIAKPGEIVVGSNTYEQTLNYYEFEALEPTQVKGKRKPINSYKLKSAKKESFKTHRLKGLQAILTGRDQEMEILTKAIGRLKEGQGSIISITGDAGTGKSRLKKELKDILNPQDIEWREGHAYGYTQTMPYYPLINFLTHAFQIDERDGTEKIRVKVEAGITFLLGENNKYVPYIGSLFSLNYPEIEEVSPEFWKDKLWESVFELLSALLEKQPAVICFEDLHWADRSFIELFKQLTVKIQTNALFIVTYRSHFSLFDNNIPDALKDKYQDVRLKELGSRYALDMVKSLLETEETPEELIEIIQQKSEGNPFYVEEIINSLIDRKILFRDNGFWKLSKEISETDIPATIQGVLTARVDRLGQNFKRILQEASVIGRTFLFKILKRITDIDTDINHFLEELVALDLIRTQSITPELEYIFKHALTQEVVYNGLLKKERQLIHERIGLAIEQLFADRLPEFYEALAFHFRRGISHFKAVDYLVKAAEKSLKRYALEESHQYYIEAFKLLSNDAARGLEGDKLLIDLILDWALVYYYRGDGNHLAPLLKRHEQVTEALGDQRRLGILYAWIGYVRFWSENYKESYVYLKKAFKIGKKLKDNAVIGYACAWLPYTCAEIGRFSEGIEFGKKVQEIAQTEELDKYIQLKSLSGIGYIHFFSGNKKGLLQVVEALDQKIWHSDPRFTGMAQNGYGFAHLLNGNFPLAVEHCLKAVNVSSDPIYSMAFRTMLGFSYLAENKFQDAREVAEKVVQFSDNSGVNWLGTMARMILCVVSIADGQISEGMKGLRVVLRESIQNERRWLHAQTECILGGVYFQMVMGSAPINITIILKNLGFIIKNIPFAFKKAAYHLNEACQVAKEIDAKGILGQANLQLGLLYNKKKNGEKAKLFLSQAIQLFEETNAELFLEQAREAIEKL